MAEIDQRLAALLRAGAPPLHDPIFRLRVLERRERQRFQRRMALALVAGGAAIVVAWYGYATRADSAHRIGVLLLYMIMAASAFMHAPVVAYFVRRFLDAPAHPQRS